MRWLGVDAGEARVGLAISDPEGRFAIPLEVVPTAAAFPAIRAIVEREAVTGIVVGLARLPSGDEGDAARMARRLGARLERLGVPVEYEDETLTSAAAEDSEARRSQTHGRQAGRGGMRSRGRPADDLAASLILQQFLDRQDQNERRLDAPAQGTAHKADEDGQGRGDAEA